MRRDDEELIPDEDVAPEEPAPLAPGAPVVGAAPPPPPPPPPPVAAGAPPVAAGAPPVAAGAPPVAAGAPPVAAGAPPAPAVSIAAPAAASTVATPNTYTALRAAMDAVTSRIPDSASPETKERLKALQDLVSTLENTGTASNVVFKDLKQQLEAPVKALHEAVAKDSTISEDVKKQLYNDYNSINQAYAKHSDELTRQAMLSRSQLAREQLALAFGQSGGLPDTAIGGGENAVPDPNAHFIDRLLRDGGRVESQQAGKNYWTYAKAWLDVKIAPGGEKILKSNNPAVLAAAAKAAGYTSFEFTTGSPTSILKAMKEFAKQGIATTISQEMQSKFSAAQKEEFQKGRFKANFQDKFDSYKVISEGVTKAQDSATLREFSDPNKFSSKVAEEMDPGLEHQERYARRLGETSGYEVPGWTQQSVAKWHEAVQPTASASQKFDAAKNLDSELLKNVIKSQTGHKAKTEEKAIALNALMNQVGSGPEQREELKSLLNNMNDRVAVVKSLLALQDNDPKFKLTKDQKNDLLQVLGDSDHRESKKATELVGKDIQKDMAAKQQAEDSLAKNRPPISG